MGLAFAASCDRARELLALASDAAAADLPRLLGEGGAALDRSEILQPALTAVSLGACAALREAGIAPAAVAGHSVGEVAAFAAARALSEEDAVRLAAVRGGLMSREAGRHPGGMAALFGARSLVDAALAAEPTLELAALNAPDQWVLSGPAAAISRLQQRFPSAPVRASGAWHSRAMEGAVAEFERAAAALTWSAPAAAVYANLSGERVAEPDRLRQALTGQLIRPAHFAAGLARMWNEGIRTFIAVGSGRLLRTLVRRNLPGAEVFLAEEPDDVQRIAARCAA
jgi:[acyl-carrier-protein] S-malonyltransferase